MKILEQMATKLVATQAATDSVRAGELSAYDGDNETHKADYASIKSAKEAAFDTSSSDTVTANDAQIASNTAAFNSSVTALTTLFNAEDNNYSFAEALQIFDAESTLLSDAITAATATIDGHRSLAEDNFGNADLTAVLDGLNSIIG